MDWHRLHLFRFFLLLNCFFLLASVTLLIQSITKHPKFRSPVTFLLNVTAENEIDFIQPLPYYQVNSWLWCHDQDTSFRGVQRGRYWVYQNLVQARRTFRCNESITYSTHGDVRYLENLPRLLPLWDGPLSMAVYTPRTDFVHTVRGVLYYRHCLGTGVVRDLVSFHFYFDLDLMPARSDILQGMRELNLDSPDCKVMEGQVLNSSWTPYRTENQLVYPINVARNIAKEASNTYIQLVSDIEIYPSPGLIRMVLDQVKEHPEKFGDPATKVIVVPAFEMMPGQNMPLSKKGMVDAYEAGKATWFHGLVCPRCHIIPRWRDWLASSSNSSDRGYYTSVKRQVPYLDDWEPFFIATHDLPQFDERLNWDGKKDKMTLCYQLCLMDWDFVVLDNIFAVHRTEEAIRTRNDYFTGSQERFQEQKKYIEEQIEPEYHVLFGIDERCKRKRHQVNWTEVHGWEREFIHKLGLNISLKP